MPKLKTALLSHQSKLNPKHNSIPLKKSDTTRTTPTIPFLSTDTVLLIGEGNFSFARAFLLDPPPELDHFPPGNLTATAFDTEDACYSKYPDAQATVNTLREKGAHVLFAIDATQLEKASALARPKRTWDRVVWNFPHAGKGITDQDRNILAHQILLLGFLRSVAPLLSPGSLPRVNPSRKHKRAQDSDPDDPARDDDTKTRGTVLLTLRHVPPYTLWDIPRLAKRPPAPSPTNPKPNPPYIQLRSFKFDRSVWKGYEHRMTKGERVGGLGKPGEGGEERTWEFCLKD